MTTSQPKMLIIAGIAAVSVFIACSKEKDQVPDPTSTDPVAAVLNLPATPFNYANQALPGYYNTPQMQNQDNTQGSNLVSDDGATLGRVLFYDKSLSINNTIACASCHKQASGFSDPVVKSLGFNGGLTGRNSMSLINAKYYFSESFFWDQRAPILEDQILMPIQDMVEMGMTLPQLEAKLKGLPYYAPLFKKAFGDTVITSNRIARAVSQFIRSIISYRSKYDAGRAAFPVNPGPPPNAVFANFTAQENRGKEIFLSPIGGCAPCHGTEAFVATAQQNNGLDLVTVDRGFGAISNNVNLDATFKVTSLRNVELTAPYMHDGRFATLEQVVEHYSSGVKNHPNLSNQIRQPNGQPRLMNLTPQDKAALVAFLKTLTDLPISTDVKFSNPFK
ncbi:MAG TPA: cytochrome c peroxidase [Chitinophagaceae bacterium]|nr:cytochrome c peroxidase [Chitinophagaceae bacterium]